MKRTISIAKGKGSIGHNSREFKAENVDPDRTQYNTCFINEKLEDVYHKLFDTALEAYNAKQKRSDRKIESYYEKIRTAKQEKLFYEIIVQVGDFEDMHAHSENGELAQKILKHYMLDFQKRNPTLYVFSAHLHMDETTPHLHIDFVPYTTENKRGLETKTTLKGALNQLGFAGGTKSSTELNQWQDAEKEVMAQVMLTHGIEWEKKGTQRKHLSVEQFKAEKKAEEVAALDVTLAEKSEKLERVENKLQSMQKEKKSIDTNLYKFKEEAKWQLPNPPVLMTASTYKTKIAAPLVSALKEYIKGLTIQLIRLQSEFYKQQRTIKNLNSRLESAERRASENEQVSSRYHLLEAIIGRDEIDRIIEAPEKKKIEPDRRKSHREIDNER